jgi:tRNA uridine 5-carboxymethylaminomethyl modification enzyme
VDDVRWEAFERKQSAVEAETRRLKAVRIGPTAGGKAPQLQGKALERDYALIDLLRRPGVAYDDVAALDRETNGSAAVSRETLGRELGGAALADAVIEQVQIEAKYAGYVERQNAAVARTAHDDAVALPDGIDYDSVRALSIEVRQILSRRRPASLGEASRLPGVTPAAVALLKIYLKKQRRVEASGTVLPEDAIA